MWTDLPRVLTSLLPSQWTLPHYLAFAHNQFGIKKSSYGPTQQHNLKKKWTLGLYYVLKGLNWPLGVATGQGRSVGLVGRRVVVVATIVVLLVLVLMLVLVHAHEAGLQISQMHRLDFSITGTITCAVPSHDLYKTPSWAPTVRL